MREAKVVFPRACRLLRDLDEAGYQRLCRCLHVREHHLLNRETLAFEHEPCDKIGIVVLGRVRLSRQRSDGGRTVLEDVDACGVFGTTCAFQDAGATGVTITSVGESTVLLFGTQNITRPCCRVCEAHLRFMRNLLAVMSAKTHYLKYKLRILSLRTIRDRLVLYLETLARQKKVREFDIPFDRQALADYLCVDRSALSAELSKMRSEGLLDFAKNHFRLCPRLDGRQGLT
ncbi:MAG: Crp/Fnr family transcriptional regulator [Kiritimatiellia bacterium]